MVARRPVALERWGEVAADWLSRRVPLLLERRGRRRSRFSGVRSDEEVVPPEEGDGRAAAPSLPPVMGAPSRRGMTKTEDACRLLSPRVRWLLEGRKNGCAHVGATLSRAILWISVLKQS